MGNSRRIHRNRDRCRLFYNDRFGCCDRFGRSLNQCQRVGIRRLGEQGIATAIDDFGTGYSSLAYLSQFPVDTLKIDRSFISGIASSEASAALIPTLIQLGKALKIQTLAEGIEEPDQLVKLRNAHCDKGQGYLFSEPLRAEDALERFVVAVSRNAHASFEPKAVASVL